MPTITGPTTTGPTTPSLGFKAEGVTTLIWGTDGLVSNWGAYIVMRFNQRELVENIKLPNGTGITTTRVQLIDGIQCDITVRDDTTLSPPRVGTVVVVKDAGNLLGGGVGATYSARVIESAWESAPKQPGERSISVEKLILITEV